METSIWSAVPSLVINPLQEGVAGLRDRLGREVVSMLSSDPDDVLREFEEPAGDPGLFGPESPVWEVHADPSMFIGGIRALLLQAMHPLAMAGVSEHSDYKRNPLRRLQRTAMFVRDTTYGNTSQVETAFRRVRAMHAKVVGTAPDGRPYAASDPELLRWVHAAEIDSFLVAHSRYGERPLTPAQTDLYIDEMAEVAIRLGADWAPRSRAELDDYFEDVQPELEAGEQALETARWLLTTPAHPSGWPAQMILNIAAIGLLPPSVRRPLGLVPTPMVDPIDLVDPVLVRPAAQLLVRTIGWALGPHGVREAAARRWMAPTPAPGKSRRARKVEKTTRSKTSTARPKRKPADA